MFIATCVPNFLRKAENKLNAGLTGVCEHLLLLSEKPYQTVVGRKI